MTSNKGSFQVYDESFDEISYERLIFSGGEVQVKITGHVSQRKAITIEAHLSSSDLLIELLLLTEAIRRMTRQPIKLICPYFPYARQDRVMNPGEALAVKVIAQLINNLGFDSVEVWDVHSDVTLALLDRAVNYPPQTWVQMIPVDKSKTILVAPDAGAMKKVGAVAKGLGFEMISAEKKRNTKTGEITGTVVHAGVGVHAGNYDFLVVDDICDGGRTFTELAKELKKLTTGRILLYVTHGIFSKGLGVFGDIDHIYTAMPFPGVDLTSDKLTHLKYDRTQ